MLLNDKDVRRYCTLVAYHRGSPMIEPFSEGVSGGGVISYGLTSAGYDLRLAPEVLVFASMYDVVDPKRFGDEGYRTAMLKPLEIFPAPHDQSQRFVILPPHSYALGRSHEYLRIPGHLKARCVGKSTLARSGILINTTPLEPGWEGHLTIEIGNVTPCPARLWLMEGIAQTEFEALTGPPETDYAGKRGKYQGQTGVTPAKVV